MRGLQAVALAAMLAAGECQSRGTVQAAYDLLERILPGSSAHFGLAMTSSCPGISAGTPCFMLSDDNSGSQVQIAGTSASEITAGIGYYLMQFCNMSFGWPRGGGSNVFTPATWPTVGQAVVQARTAPYSYIMNVCTHSYSLVWYSWSQWEGFIDWMALHGINLALAMTGQEEVQYKVFQALGLDDLTIRSWFNGPAFLTWSRGQNEYGNNIAGPLPRSWMKSQWQLQIQILTRYRSLGIVSQLPGFQGNVPWALAAVKSDSNMTQQGDTGWMYSTDALFAQIADLWMQTMCADFNCTDHWYQLDGYFDGGEALAPLYAPSIAFPNLPCPSSSLPFVCAGTAPWMVQGVGAKGSPGYEAAMAAQGRHGRAGSRAPTAQLPTSSSSLPACQWSTAQPDTYLAGCDDTNCISYDNLAAAQAACLADYECGGLTGDSAGSTWQLRAGNSPMTSPSNEQSYYITNYNACRGPPPPIVPDAVWMERGAAAYMGLNRTDPDAIWSFQGWAIVDWSTQEQGRSFRGFVDAVPQGKFAVVDMSVDGSGEWQKWNNSAFFGAGFVWTTLHDFGGTDGMKGDLARINLIPTTAPSGAAVWGTGYTPEGIDQNPAYYDFMMQQNWRAAQVTDITAWAVDRAHRRYGLTSYKSEVATAWALLVNSTYAQDLSVQDSTGIPHFPGSSSQFQADRRTPTPRLCLTWQAWGAMLKATSYINANALETFRYDLVNLGREMLAQLATPVSMNFSDAINAKSMDPATVAATGSLYVQLLLDADTLVGTDSAFLLGPWLDMARQFGANSSDCANGDQPMDCPSFYEWNARSQLTTWNPVPYGAAQIPGGPIDYASKHWSGLIKDYYAARAQGILGIALDSANAGQPLNTTAVQYFKAQHSYEFQNGFPNPYPLTPQGDPVAISQAMYNKYSTFYAAC